MSKKRLGFTCGEWAAIGLTIAAMVLLVGGIWFKQVSDEVFRKTYLYAYCQEYDKSSDCNAWRDTVYSQQRQAVIACLDKYDFFEYRFGFYGCLREKGV